MSGNYIRSLILDVLKPHEPSIVELANRLAYLQQVASVHITVLEVDANTETVKISLTGDPLDFAAIRADIEQAGATIHSIDQVAAGRHLLLEGPTREQQT
jgi:hypothetical protein